MQNPISTEKLTDLEQRMAALGITEGDLLEKFVRGSGAGGQKINKTSNCVFLKHLPSGVCIKCQMDRSREMNRFLARRELCEQLEAHPRRQGIRQNPGHRENAPPETPALAPLETTLRR